MRCIINDELVFDKARFFLTLTHSHLKVGKKLRVGGGREEKGDKRNGQRIKTASHQLITPPTNCYDLPLATVTTGTRHYFNSIDFTLFKPTLSYASHPQAPSLTFFAAAHFGRAKRDEGLLYTLLLGTFPSFDIQALFLVGS